MVTWQGKAIATGHCHQNAGIYTQSYAIICNSIYIFCKLDNMYLARQAMLLLKEILSKRTEKQSAN
jgi:NADH:ubiquinone oxidoreductase subunit B-like Fe-S oxidoreductase